MRNDIFSPELSGEFFAITLSNSGKQMCFNIQGGEPNCEVGGGASGGRDQPGFVIGVRLNLANRHHNDIFYYVANN
jgi:hypothetical protein